MLSLKIAFLMVSSVHSQSADSLSAVSTYAKLKTQPYTAIEKEPIANKATPPKNILKNISILMKNRTIKTIIKKIIISGTHHRLQNMPLH